MVKGDLPKRLGKSKENTGIILQELTRQYEVLKGCYEKLCEIYRRLKDDNN